MLNKKRPKCGIMSNPQCDNEFIVFSVCNDSNETYAVRLATKNTKDGVTTIDPEVIAKSFSIIDLSSITTAFPYTVMNRVSGIGLHDMALFIHEQRQKLAARIGCVKFAELDNAIAHAIRPVAAAT